MKQSAKDDEDRGEARMPPAAGSISVADLAGAGAVAERLLGMLERGLGWSLRPFTKRRDAASDRAIAKSWIDDLSDAGLELRAAELTLDGRAVVRIRAEASRSQQNREEIAALAVEDLKRLPPASSSPTSEGSVDIEWIDNFWRLAETASSIEKRALWARVLTRRAHGHRFSARALHLLGTITAEEAAKIENLAGMVISSPLRPDLPSRVLTNVGGWKWQWRDRDEIGDAMVELVLPIPIDFLGPVGVFLENMDTEVAFPGVDGSVPLLISGQPFEVRAVEHPLAYERRPQDFESAKAGIQLGRGLTLTSLGKEIMALANPSPSLPYVVLLGQRLREQGWELAGADGKRIS